MASLTKDERDLLQDIVRYERVRASRDYRPATGLLKKGLVRDETPTESTMMLVPTDVGRLTKDNG